MLDLFDTPMMEINCPERNVSTVPLQALALLHGPFSERNAAALADRILQTAAAEWDQTTERLGKDSQKAFFAEYKKLPGSSADHTVEAMGMGVKL